MKLEKSGHIYKFPLDFQKGFAYAEILDFSDISSFDGILVKVFNLIEGDKDSQISTIEIKRTGVMLGPLPVNKYPVTKGKSEWVFYGKDKDFDQTPPVFKHLRGLLNKNDWAKLAPWFIQDRFGDKNLEDERDYEEIRNLETMILNHIDSVKIKITMMKIIEEGKNVNDFYSLENLGNKNLFLQVVNTYYEKKVAEKLLATLP